MYRHAIQGLLSVVSILFLPAHVCSKISKAVGRPDVAIIGFAGRRPLRRVHGTLKARLIEVGVWDQDQ